MSKSPDPHASAGRGPGGQSSFSSFDARRPTLPRHRGVEIVKTLVVVVPLTLLIWVYAERAQSTVGAVQTMITFSVAEPSLAASTAGPADTQVTVELSGARGQIDQFKTKLERQSDDHHLRLILTSADAAAGPHDIDLARLLNDSTLLSDTGVTVTKTTPLSMRVNVDPVVTIEAKVELPGGLPVKLETHTFQPSYVSVRGPAPAINAQFNAEAPTITADVASVLSLLNGSERTVDVPLAAMSDARLRPAVPSVKMTFQLGSREQDYTIPSVAIQTQRPLSLEGRLKVDFGRTLPVIPNVRIRGPVNVVSQYTERAGGTPPERLVAVLVVKPEDVGRSGLSRDVEWSNLKPGLVVIGNYPVVFDVKDLSEPDR